VDTVTEPARPLTDEEKRVLRDLMSRENAFTGPATRIGDEYVALVNLSVPRRGDKDRQTDLVMRGETLYLTEEEAMAFNRHGTRDGRQIEVVRKVSGPGGTHAELPRPLPRHVSGRLFRPPPPPPGSDQARPDPPESSAVQVLTAEEGNAPETAGAMTADPQEMSDLLRQAAAPDALDLPPTRARNRRSGS
jgi:hypothetical protein